MSPVPKTGKKINYFMHCKALGKLCISGEIDVFTKYRKHP